LTAAALTIAAAQTRPSSGDAHPYATSAPMPEPRLFAPGTISTGDDESHPAFTPDGRTLYFLKNTPSFDTWTIVTSRFDRGRWTTPEVAPFSGRFSDADPFITADGKRFFFISTRPVADAAKEDTDIWTMERTDNGWGSPRHVDGLSSPASEWFPTLTADGTVYFGSGRDGGVGATDLWRARPSGSGYAPPEHLGPAINTRAGEFEPYVAPDESYMIFAAIGRPDSFGAYDLYLSRRENGIWMAPTHLPRPINSDGWDFAPRVSPDGKYLFFASSRRVDAAPPPAPLTYRQLLEKIHAPGNGLRDIYQVDLSTVLANRHD